MRAFPTSTNANEHVILALGSDRMGWDAGVGVSPRVARPVQAYIYVCT